MPNPETGQNVTLSIKTGQIVLPPILLRPVREDSIEFMNLMVSLRDNGFLNSISVREHPDRPGVFQVVDGAWRYFAAKKLDFPKIPCILKVGVTDDKLLELQIQANAVRYETSPVEFAEHMQRLIRIHEDVGAPLSIAMIAKMVGQSTAWVQPRLKLNMLSDELKDKVRDGQLSLGKAVALSRIMTHKKQNAFADEYEFNREPKNRLTNRDFNLAIGRYINQMKNNRADKPYEKPVYTPRLQSLGTLVAELDSMKCVSQLIMENNAETALEGAKLMLEWVLKMDRRSREGRRLRNPSRRERLELIRRQNYPEFEDCD